MIEVAALTKEEKIPIPVYTRLFSQKEEDFVSRNEEYLRAIDELEKRFGKIGIFLQNS